MEYLKIWTSFAEIIEPLNDAERGRLFTAMLNYADHKELPEFKGNERYIWPMAKQVIDRARADSEKQTANGSKGGRPKNPQKPTENQENPQKPTESLKDNNNNKEKEKEINNNSNSARAWLSDDEIAESLDRDRQIEDAAKRWGLPCSEGNMIHARDLAREYTQPWLLRAIETAGNGKEQTWRYTEGILKSWKDNGGPDAPRKQRASQGKTVSAQNYTQRDYTPEELDAVSGDLLAEARAQREATA